MARTETFPDYACAACGEPIADGFRVHATCIVGLGAFHPEHAPNDWAVRQIRQARDDAKREREQRQVAEGELPPRFRTIERLEVENAGYVAQAETYRLRAAKAEAVLIALVARLDAGGTPADVLADLATILDETRTGDPSSCSS